VSPAHPAHAARGQPERSRAFCLPWLPFGEIGGCQGRRCTKKFGKTAGPLCTMHVGHPRARGSNLPKEKKFFFEKKFPSRKGGKIFFRKVTLRGAICGSVRFVHLFRVRDASRVKRHIKDFCARSDKRACTRTATRVVFIRLT
jgi:hypothetical protein